MALIPDEAIESMTELSAGAWRLYCYLARRRNHNTGQCNPSVSTCAEAIGVHPKNIFKLRKELSVRSWAMFNGDTVTHLAWLSGSKNATSESQKHDQLVAKTLLESSKNATIELQKHDQLVAKTLLESSKNATIESQKHDQLVAKTLLESSKNATIELQKRYSKVAKTLPNGSKNATPYKEEPAKEPAKRERESTRALSVAESFSTVEQTLAKVCSFHPDTLTDKQILSVKENARRLEAARGFDVALLARWPEFWNNHLGKSAVPSRPEYVLEHFGRFLSWAKGAAA